MIVVTGAAGFIGSCLVGWLNKNGYNAIVAVDNFGRSDKAANLYGKQIMEKVERSVFFEWLQTNASQVEFIFHLGARTDTTEMDYSIFESLNLNYSKQIWQACVEAQIPLVYASSAATYGLGEHGYEDENMDSELLKPLNPYGISKNEFDKWALAQEEKPFFWAGLKFFNVYGPNEYHKSRMASVIFHAFNQISKSGKMALFRSHRPDYTDGGQMRDFVYVKDLLEICTFFMHTRKHSGIYNLGSGQARTFLDLAQNVFGAMKQRVQIDFKDTPIDIRDNYQYFTQANMQKIRLAGYDKPFYSLEQGIQDYVQNYLSENIYY